MVWWIGRVGNVGLVCVVVYGFLCGLGLGQWNGSVTSIVNTSFVMLRLHARFYL